MAKKHSGNMVGGGGVDAAIEESMRHAIDEAAERAEPCIGYSWRANKDTGAAELVVAGKHPLTLRAVAIVVDPINALLLAGVISNGIAGSMIEGARMAERFGKPEKVD